MTLSSLVVLLTLAAVEPQLTTSVTEQTVEPGPQKLGVFVGLGYLGAPGSHGSAFSSGVRLALGSHVALGFDLGWGLIAAPVVYDRWWLMPTVACVIPAGRARFDLGVGAGLATSSGYDSLGKFAAGPFMPDWAFQLVPAVRGHAMASMPLSKNLDGFVRLDVGSLVLGGNTIGFRDGNPNPSVMDTLWLNLSLGVAFRLL